MKIVILEHIGDTGNWEWYNIYQAKIATPKQAIKSYLTDMSLDKQKIIRKGDEWYAEFDDVRAFYYEI